MKKRNNAGFTLAETLLTVALLGIVLSVVGAAFMAMRETYTKVTLKAEALTLYSTAEMELSDQMHNASDITTDNDQLSFVSDGLTYTYANDSDKGILLQADGDPLVTDKTNSSDLYTAFDNYSYDNGVFTMNLQVKHGSDIIYEHEIKVKPYAEVIHEE